MSALAGAAATASPTLTAPATAAYPATRLLRRSLNGSAALDCRRSGSLSPIPPAFFPTSSHNSIVTSASRSHQENHDYAPSVVPSLRESLEDHLEPPTRGASLIHEAAPLYAHRQA